MRLRSFPCAIALAALISGSAVMASALDIRPDEASAKCGASPLQIAVNVAGVSAGGILTVELYRPSTQDFLRKASRLHRIRVPAAQGEQTVCFDVAAPGTYAVAAYDDLNADRKLARKWNQLPDEPYALSNNRPLRLEFPKFEDAAFEVPAAGAKIRIELQK